MLLAIDAGNTNVVFALVDGGRIRARWRIATDPRRTARTASATGTSNSSAPTSGSAARAHTGLRVAVFDEIVIPMP